MEALSPVPTTRLHVPRVVPLVFVVTAGLGLLAFRVPFPHPHFLMAVALCFASLSAVFAARPHKPAANAGYLALELLAITLIVWASDGLRSPLMGLYLVFILECSMAYAQPWGLLSATAAAASAELSQLVINHGVLIPNAAAELDLSRLAATYAFFAMVGLLTSAQSEVMSRRQARYALEKAQHETMEAMERYQMSIAREIQQTLLPFDKPASDHWDSHWVVRPQQAVGGDFVHFFAAGNGLGCVVADVTGKGVSAALLTGSLHQMVLRFGHLSPEVALARINALLVDSTPTGFSVSMLIVKLLPDGDVLYANAGHPYPLMVRGKDGAVEPWESGDLLAGLFCDIEYKLHHRHLEPGDTLLLYTDGLSDVLVKDKEQFGESGIVGSLTGSHLASLDTVASKLLEPLEKGHQVDDVTLLLLRRLSVAAGPIVPHALLPARHNC